MSDTEFPRAPSWHVSQWFNTAQPITLEGLRGKIVVLHVFQMLCPGCVAHGLPQAQRLHAQFQGDGVVVVGLHSVFEHHAAMTPVSLAAFIHEYRIGFAVGVDLADQERPIPRTMQAYGLRGTPSLLVIDRQGSIRLHEFGQVDDLALGVFLGRLLAQGDTH